MKPWPRCIPTRRPWGRNWSRSINRRRGTSQPQAAQATYLGQATATSQALSGLKAQVTGQLAEAVAQASLARAAAAAAAVTHAENRIE